MLMTDNLYYGNVHKIVNEWELRILKAEIISSRKGQREEGKGVHFSVSGITDTLTGVCFSSHDPQISCTSVQSREGCNHT